MTFVTLRPFHPSDIDWLVDQHQTHYANDEGFDDTFGPLVRRILVGFAANQDPRCEAGWIAQLGKDPVGSIFCVRHDQETAKLRLFLLKPEARGQRLGQRLLETCTDFATTAGYAKMTLWTHESHQAACALYARNGWRLVASKPVRSFGCNLVEQTWTLQL